MRISRILKPNQCKCKSFSFDADIFFERRNRRRLPCSKLPDGAANFLRSRLEAKKRARRRRTDLVASSFGRATTSRSSTGGHAPPADRRNANSSGWTARPVSIVPFVRRAADLRHRRAPPTRDESSAGQADPRSYPSATRRSAPARLSWRRISRRGCGRDPRRNRPAPPPPPRSSAADRRDILRNRRNSGSPDAIGR